MSGAQLSNYATFLVHPEQAPLSIVLTALSTAAGVFMTPVLALLLLGARIPVDARGMALSITQIVLVPVLAGGLLSVFVSPSKLSGGVLAHAPADIIGSLKVCCLMQNGAFVLVS